ncbi:unnamed protein product [Kuraishia capsulata CBS 1993]|uniref:Transcription initiation factor TFIID subunit 10 n=1 Tax=Kuraishia capsulata CBS 1993 TaxID=1382522 RepID=W6MXM3_9ASCO|nr:uncharacterized protein KUCA_T00005127001 [Kuraishia capsulata CBS 1993]CDK29140.1 unnamed protein product [Kuraishia capsulata CBS 1993]
MADNLFSNNDVDELMENDGSVGAEDTREESAVPPPQLPEFTRKDKTLEEILEMMDDEDFTPIIPDLVTDYYLAKNGFETSDVKIKRLLALATQKFVSDVATNAYEYSRIRSQSAVYNSTNPQARAKQLLAGQQQINVSNGDETATASGGGGGGSFSNNHDKKVVLTMEDLSLALGEYGLNVNRPDFYR